MAVQLTYPGVYIDEFTPGAPIVGVGTSTAAFIGPATRGPMNTPTKLTSFKGFTDTFGPDPVPGSYLWYAVRGFFENRGTVCYVIRATNGVLDTLDLDDANGAPTIHLVSRTTPDATAPVPIKVSLANVTAVSAKGFRPKGTVKTGSGTAIQLKNASAVADAAQFLSGNSIIVDDGTNSETATVVRVDADIIRVTTNLTNTYTSGTVRLASVVPNTTTTMRLIDAGDLAAGAVVEFSQGTGAATITEIATVKRVDAERISPTLTTYRVTLAAPLAQAFDLTPGAAGKEITVKSKEFSLTVGQGTTPAKTYDNLAMDPLHPRYFATVINSDPTGLINASPIEPPNTSTPPTNIPDVITAGNAKSLTGGSADNPTTLQAQHFKAALDVSDGVDDINLICIPDRQDADVQMAIVAHCENMQDRFGILDSKRGAPQSGTGSVAEQIRSVEGNNGGYAALYYPWISVAPASGSIPLLVPPCGHVAGVYARTDQRRGVFKAPAGIEAGVNGALGVDQVLTDVEQGELNKIGVNVIRVFRPGDAPVVWGARTTATEKNPSWQYVNIRRLFLFLEESIQDGIAWALFEPNIQPLWKKLKRTIGAFLLEQWRAGALFGEKPERAFYVRIDEELNPDSEREKGRLYIEIGIRPAYPAEFIVVRIGIWDGGSDVSEA